MTRLLPVFCLFLLAACADPAPPANPPAPTAPAAAATTPASPAPTQAPDTTRLAPAPASSLVTDASTQPRLDITVHKSPTCGCCAGWVDHLRREGFEVKVVEQADLAPVKRRLGVPTHLHSCHTAEIQGLFVEGHVPAEDIRQMVANQAEGADLRGVAVPGMPAGSPGMEMGGRVDPYQVIEVTTDGTESVFATHPAP